MYTSDVVAYFGSKSAVAERLGVSPSAVSQWDELVPPLSAAKIAKLTEGELVFDPDLYDSWNKPKSSH